MRGNSAASYVEKPRLGASGVKMTPENLIEIDFPRGNFKIAPQNRFRINWVAVQDTTVPKFEFQKENQKMSQNVPENLNPCSAV